MLVASVRLADAALRVGDHDHRHAGPPSSFCGYVSGARRARHPDSPASPPHVPARPDRPPTATPPHRSRADILVIVAHPQLEQSRVNRRLLEAARALERAAPPGASTVRDLYALYPDYLIDVAAEQARSRAAELVVWQHPIHWYRCRRCMKLWLDEVLAFGWAYGPGGTALRGKDLWLVATTGGPEDSYRPTATTATSSTPSCRPTSRPPRCAACASCRR